MLSKIFLLFILFHNGIPCCSDFFPSLLLFSPILECLLIHPCRMWGSALSQHKLRKPLFHKPEAEVLYGSQVLKT